MRDELARLGAMRSFVRDVNLGREPDVSIADAVGMTQEQIEDAHPPGHLRAPGQAGGTPSQRS